MTSTPEDIEIPEAASGAGPSVSTLKVTGGQVVVDENHPFDLDAYLASYTDLFFNEGRTAYLRAVFIAQRCPSLAQQAYQFALANLLQGTDVQSYITTISSYNALPGVPQVPQDQAWIDKTSGNNTNERARLEVDLKNYSANMIKESVRLSHRELGRYYHGTGDYAAALRNHMKSREFCTNASHVVEMCISVLEVLLEQQNYAHLSTYIYKAETALDASQPNKAAGKSTGGAAGAGSPDRAKVQAKLEFASAMSEMGAGRYDKAAYGFLKMKNDLGDWNGKVVTPSDIAIYGTLCALASLSRSAIKAAVLESETFGYYLEQEPYIRDILDAYMGSKFKDVLLLMERYSSRHSLDIHLAHHVPTLAQQIRNRALVLYFQPFATVHLERMAAAFGMELADMEANIVKLIEEGLIKARIDSQNKILRAKDHDPRVELYNRAVAAGLETEASARKVLWRMKLLQADLIIKAPKGQRGEGRQDSFPGSLMGWDELQ
ncbi:hypothetical protein FRB90_003476 [Tulasnella sp. 427]|nr:hypothetical protein FRB90_003476 [Tulasnella sp. 427]